MGKEKERGGRGKGKGRESVPLTLILQFDHCQQHPNTQLFTGHPSCRPTNSVRTRKAVSSTSYWRVVVVQFKIGTRTRQKRPSNAETTSCRLQLRN